MRRELLRLAMWAAVAVAVVCFGLSRMQGAELPAGFYALQPGDMDRPISERQLRLPNVDGLAIRLRGSWIAKGGKWQWQFPDKCVALARKVGKPYTITLMSGDSNKPWSAANVKYYSQLFAGLGWRYGNDCAAVRVTGCTPPGAPSELHWPKITPEIAEANRQLIDAVNKAFPKSVLILSCSGKDAGGQLAIIDYGLRVAPGRFYVGHNSLKANTSLSADHNQLVITAARMGAGIGLQPACPAGNVARFGPGGIMAGVEKGRELARMAGYYPAKLYLEIYPPDLEALR